MIKTLRDSGERVYHKGAIAPLYIGGWCGLASTAPIHLENLRFRGNRHSIRNPSS